MLRDAVRRPRAGPREREAGRGDRAHAARADLPIPIEPDRHSRGDSLSAPTQSAISEEGFRARYGLVDRHVAKRYGIPVVITDVLDPNTGVIDGERIQVDYDQSA